MKDARYVVNQAMIDSMRQMRKTTGLSYQKIADIHGVSYSVAYYWINDRSRAQQRAKNAKRKYPPKDKARIQRDMLKRKQNFASNPDMKLRHEIQTAKDEKRVKRKSVRGMKMDEAEKILKSKSLSQPNNKMRD